MADEDLFKQDEKEQGKWKVVANDGKWTPRTEISEINMQVLVIILHRFSVTFIHGFTKCFLRSSWIRNTSKQEEEL